MNKSLKTRGLIVSEKVSGEQDKRLTLLCVDHGKMYVTAKGAKKQGAKLSGGSQLFFYNDFMLEQSRGSLIIQDLQVIEGFYALRKDLDCMALASWMCETASEFALEGEPCNELLKLLLRALQALRNPELQHMTTALTFVLRAMGLQGLRPDLDEWAEKARTRTSAGAAFSGDAVDPAMIYTLRHIFDAPEEKLFQFHLSNELSGKIFAFTRQYLYQYIQKELQSIRFLESVLLLPDSSSGTEH